MTDVLAELDRSIRSYDLLLSPPPACAVTPSLNALLVKVLDSLVGRLEDSSHGKRVLGDDLRLVLGDRTCSAVFFNLSPTRAMPCPRAGVPR